MKESRMVSEPFDYMYKQIHKKQTAYLRMWSPVNILYINKVKELIAPFPQNTIFP